jgi:hypothetical protein
MNEENTKQIEVEQPVIQSTQPIDQVSQSLEQNQQTDQQPSKQKITLVPKKNCKKCNGIGRLGFIDGNPNNPYICQCVLNNMKKLKKWKDDNGSNTQ